MPFDTDIERRVDLFAAAIRGQVAGDVDVSVRLERDPVSLSMFASDASMYEQTPLAVCYPREARDVARIVEVASSLDLPVLPRGGASSLAGQTVGQAIVLDFTRHMNAILHIDPEALTATVQPGAVLENLNLALAEYGLMVGPDPASGNRATLGGMVANNATGTHSIVYGNVERHIVSVDAILADGSAATFSEVDATAWRDCFRRPGLEGRIYRGLDELIASRGDVIRRDTTKHWRRNSGYRLETMLDPNARNIARLLCGSEGTLAVTTELTIRVVPKPAHTVLGIVHFASRGEALRAVTAILKTDPTAVELLDGVAIEQCRSMPAFLPRMGFVEGDPGAVLITEYSGDSTKELLASLERLRDVGVGYSVVTRTERSGIAEVWSVRREALGLVTSVKGDLRPVAFIEDASVPVDQLANYVERLDEFMTSTGTRAAFYAHASAGCLHIRPFIDTKRASEVKKMVAIARKSMQLVRTAGGSVSSEHGDGRARSWLNPELLGQALYDANVEVKQFFDERNLLNPGNVVHAPPMDKALRYGDGYQTPDVSTRYDFAADGGFVGAVEQCSGMGTCRKTVTGVMCPSYMATGEERDSTRGRANALRAALSGRIDRDLLYSPAMHDVMDLCIQCKACKTECPTGVDMAAIKAEWLARYKDTHGWSLRDRLFARMPDISRFASGPLSGVVNGLNASRLVRRVMEKALGIDRTRELPRFARVPFVEMAEDESGASTGPRIALFADTFSNYNDPAVPVAARRVLARAGYSVEVVGGTVCCGRTRISKGDLKGAAAVLRDAIDALFPVADQGIPIIGLEPSCIHTFGDEAKRLLPNDKRVDTVAAACRSFERFVAEDSDGLFARISFVQRDAPVLLHGHCHQKTIEGTGFATRVLRMVSSDVTEVDSSCCGMAGSFGYESEHVEVSKKMAERRLAPAVRAMPESGFVVAPGTSCRGQIGDVAGVRALHPAEFLAASLPR